MNNRWNLPPGCSPRDTEWPPDIRSWHERAIDFMREHRELPDTQEVREYVMQRFANDDEPTPNEVLAWVEGQVEQGVIDPPPLCPECNGHGYRYDEFRNRVACPCGTGCSQCGHHPCACADVSIK